MIDAQTIPFADHTFDIVMANHMLYHVPDRPTLMQACWTFFDEVRMRVSAEMQKGPRGGGRDRDRIVRHTLGSEQEWAAKVGVHTPEGAVVTDEGLRAYRDAYCTAIRAFHSEGKMARTWPLRYLIRHTAYHTLDHAWELKIKT